MKKASYICKTLPLGSEIPKIIHQTYTRAAITQEIEDAINALKSRNPNWEHRLYRDKEVEEFILEYYGQEVLDCYHSINEGYGASRADLFRYLVIYQFGGVYFDIKSTATKPLDEVAAMSHPFLITHWDNENDAFEKWFGKHKEIKHIAGGEYIQWGIVAVAGHPFMKAAIERVVNNLQNYNAFYMGVGQKGALNTTGPVAYTLAIHPILHQHKHSFVRNYKDVSYVYSIYGQGNSAYKKLFTKHYTQIKTPLVKPKTIADYLWWYAAVVRQVTRNYLLLIRNKIKGVLNATRN